MELQQTFSLCPYDCPTVCGFYAVHDGVTLLEVNGASEHPITKGFLCHKMKRYASHVNSPKRILTPLKRTGAKGAGEFTPISWEEAISTITETWKSIIATDGPTAIAHTYYAGVMSAVQRHCGQAFFHRLGACHLTKSLCSSAKGAGYAAVVGKTGCLDPRELEHSELLILWGCNVTATRMPLLKTITELKQKGVPVLQINVHGGAEVHLCDETYLIKPGTDGALALGLMHELLRLKLADEAWLLANSEGYEEFKATLSAYTPTWAEAITGIPAEKITALATRFGHVKAPAILLGSGNSRYLNGGMTVRLITLLSLFTGAWQYPGGGLCGATPSGSGYINENLIQRPDFRTNDAPTININQLGAALASDAPHRIRSLYVYGNNPANSVSDQCAIYRGLAREDLFTVVCERFMTDTARYADIILPATFSVEQSDVNTAYGYCSLAAARQAIPPKGEAKSNWDTFALLAKGMGFTEDYFTKTADEMVDEVLAHLPASCQSLTEQELALLKQGGAVSMPFADHTKFQTPSGRFYFVNPNQPSPMPKYTTCYAFEDQKTLLADENSAILHLVSVPSSYTLNSIFQHDDTLADARGPQQLVLHRSVAEALQLQDGDRILVENDLASVAFYASITDAIAPNACAAIGVYNSKQSIDGLTANALHHGRISDIGAATTMNDNAVRVRKA